MSILRSIDNENENCNYNDIFYIDDWSLLERFIILGSEKSCYTSSNIKYIEVRSLERLLNNTNSLEEIERIIEWIVEISESGRAPKQEYGIYALSLAARHDNNVRKIVFSKISRFCRTFSTLTQFLSYVGDDYLSWGRSTKRELNKWFIKRSPDELAYQLTKYRNRNGYTPKDILRLVHINPTNLSLKHKQVLEFIVKNKISFDTCNDDEYDEDVDNLRNYLENTLIMKKSNDVNEIVELIKKYKYQWEHIGNQQLLNNAKIWETIIDNNIGATAFIRNLERMIKINVDSNKIVNKLKNIEWLKRSRMHPIQMLVAYNMLKSKNLNNVIINELEKSIIETMKYQRSINKKILIALDVSGSMTYTKCIGTPQLSAMDAACTIALTIANTEPEENVHFVAFSNDIIPINIKPGMLLSEVYNEITPIAFGTTDCSAPFEYALNNDIDVDCIIVITDSETNCNKIPPIDALNKYRNIMNPNAKLIVMAMSSNDISIADPCDQGMLDISGIDTAAYEIMVDFINI